MVSTARLRSQFHKNPTSPSLNPDTLYWLTFEDHMLIRSFFRSKAPMTDELGDRIAFVHPGFTDEEAYRLLELCHVAHVDMVIGDH